MRRKRTSPGKREPYCSTRRGAPNVGTLIKRSREPTLIIPGVESFDLRQQASAACVNSQPTKKEGGRKKGRKAETVRHGRRKISANAKRMDGASFELKREKVVQTSEEESMQR